MFIALPLFLISIIVSYVFFTTIVFIVWVIEQISLKFRSRKTTETVEPKHSSTATTPLLRWLVWPPSYFKHSGSKGWPRVITTILAPFSIGIIFLFIEAIGFASGNPMPFLADKIAHEVHAIAPEVPSFRLSNYGVDISQFPDYEETFYFTFKGPLNEEFLNNLDGWSKQTSPQGDIYYEKGKSFSKYLEDSEFIDHFEYVRIYPDRNEGSHTFLKL